MNMTELPTTQMANAMTSVTGDSQQGSTKLTTDTDRMSVEPKTINLIKQIIEATKQGDDSSIMDFLSKPQRLASGLFSTSDNSTLQLLQVPSIMLDNPIIAKKLANVAWSRADIEITLTVNATRFQQGRYILAFIPNGGVPSSAHENVWYRMHNANKMTLTQCPHVEIDLSQQTTVSLKIPFYSSSLFIRNDSAKRIGIFNGNIVLVPYAPLKVGPASPNSASYTIWGSFTDIHLAGVVAQSGEREKEAENIQQKYVSGGTFPSLAASKPSWWLDFVADGARSLGHSKPNISKPIQRMDRKPMVYTNTSDAANSAAPLGVSSDNCVVTPTGLGTVNEDEMSIDFIKTRFAYWKSFLWTPSDNIGNQLYAITHNPMEFYENISGGYTFPPITLLTRSFKYWRGGMVFRFKLVKTEFHSGRLAFSYNPGDQRAGLPNLSLDNTLPLWREVIDIRETSEFAFCVPYIHPDAWRLTKNDTGVGTLLIHVVDALICPETVTPSITVIIEVAGDEDFEVAMPLMELQWTPVAPPSAQSGYKSLGCDELGNKTLTNLVELHTIGEKITSIKQLLLRSQRLIPSAGFRNYPTYDMGTNGLVISPYAISVDNQGLLTKTQSLYTADSISLWSPCFVYSAGGMNFGIKQTETSLDLDIVPSFNLGGCVDITNTGTQILTNGRPVGTGVYSHIYSVEGSMAWVSLPMYCRAYARPNAVFTKNTEFGNISTTQSVDEPTITVYSFTSAGPKTFAFYRSCCDDFILTGWLGTVPYGGI